MQTDIPTKVRLILSNHFGILPENVSDTVRLVHNLGADGLDMVEIAMKLDEAFQIEISEKDMKKFVTVGDVVAYLSTRVAA